MLHCNKCHREPQSFDDVAPAVVKSCIYLQIGERGEREILVRSGYKLERYPRDVLAGAFEKGQSVARLSACFLVPAQSINVRERLYKNAREAPGPDRA